MIEAFVFVFSGGVLCVLFVAVMVEINERSEKRRNRLIRDAEWGYVWRSINLDDIVCKLSKMYKEEN